MRTSGVPVPNPDPDCLSLRHEAHVGFEQVWLVSRGIYGNHCDRMAHLSWMRQWVGLITGLILVSVTAYAASPPNDDYFNRTVLEGESITVTAQFLHATVEPVVDDPPIASIEPGRFHYLSLQGNPSGSLWWEWTAPRSGSIVLTAAPATGDPLPLPELPIAAFTFMALSRLDHSQLGLLYPPLLDSSIGVVSWAERSWRSLPYQGLAYHVVKGQRYLVYGIGNATNPAAVSFQLQMTGGPVIVQDPSDLEVTAGDSGLLTVVALGVPLPGTPIHEHPLRYTWLHQGEPVAGASHSALALLSVSVRDAGDYQVIVTDAEGSVTSAVARVEVIIEERPPQLQRLDKSSEVTGMEDRLGWVLSGSPGRTYVIEASTDLIRWSWQPVKPISALSVEALVTRTTCFRCEPPSHVRVRHQPFGFTAAGEARPQLFLRARRATPFDSRRWAAMDAAQHAKEDYGRDVRNQRALTYEPALNEISSRMPAVLYLDLFGAMGVGECQGMTLVNPIGSVPIWPCVPGDPAMIDRNAYFLSLPPGVWDSER